MSIKKDPDEHLDMSEDVINIPRNIFNMNLLRF